jgi:hypothetical protein
VVLSINGTTAAELEEAKNICRETLGETPCKLIWNDGDAAQAVYLEVEKGGGAAYLPGKGSNIWMGVMHLAARAEHAVVACHDTDIMSYERGLLWRLCFPVCSPDMPYRFAKGYYGRVGERLYGRVTRLLVAPLLRAFRDVVGGTDFLALRSDNDLFAQPDGRFVGRPGTPTGITQEGPSLRGATNILLPGLDHREIAYHWRAFREQFRFIAGQEPSTLAVPAEARPVLNGLVTNLVAGVATNRPVAGAVVEVFRTDPASGARLGEALHRRETAADGVWGPVTVQSDWRLEIVLAAPGHPIAHYFRSPFPRSTAVLHLRPPAPLAEADRAAGCLARLTRPRGYFSWPRDVVLLDGREIAERRDGVASLAVAHLRLPAERAGTPIQGVFNQEGVVGRLNLLAENRISLLEMTH